MSRTLPRSRRTAAVAVSALALTGSLAAALSGTGPAVAAARPGLTPGDLVVSRLHYTGTAGMIVPGRTVFPTGITAVADGSFAHVWDNVDADGNFGVTAPIYLDDLSATGATVSTVAAPTGTPGSASLGHDVLTGSFSSKSEGALALSTDGTRLTIGGYVAAPNTIDASNGNTPGVVDATNPDAQQVYRAVGEVGGNGKFFVTETNAYSGDNIRAAVLDSSTGEYYTAGNSNNGESSPILPGLVFGTGAQLVTPAYTSEAEQEPGLPTPVGGFSNLQLPGQTKADKLGKDTNFSAVTIHDGVLYYAKGSGSNGVDTIYYVDTDGTCHNGTGIPAQGVSVPSTADSVDPVTGEAGRNMCILKGFPTTLAKKITTPEVGGIANATAFGGMWFANDTTLYVADAGNGDQTYAGGVYTGAAAQTLAGIQKWSLVDGTWTYDYTLQTGLGLGASYAADGMPAGTNPATGLPWAPGVDGVRNITGKVNADGSVTLYGVTSTVGGVTDAAADPNKVVSVTDVPAATTQPAGEAYTVLRTAAAGDVYRGTAFAPAR